MNKDAIFAIGTHLAYCGHTQKQDCPYYLSTLQAFIYKGVAHIWTLGHLKTPLTKGHTYRSEFL